MTFSTSVRRLATLGSIGAFAVLLAGCSSTDSSGDAQPAGDSAEVSWLYSQTSDAGRLEMTDGRATTLVMSDVDPHTIAFSDRPERLTEVTDTAALTDAWDELFGDDPPNAVLVEHRPDGETDSVVLVLRRPVYDATARTLAYDVEVLTDEEQPESIKSLGGQVHEVPPTEFDAVSLFIDCTIIPPPPPPTTTTTHAPLQPPPPTRPTI